MFEDGTPLVRERFVAKLCEAPLTHQYAGHSFRIGAATAAAQAGLSDSLITTGNQQHL